MSDPKETWREVGSKAEALGLKLKLHLEQEHEEGAEPEPGDTKAMVEDLGRRVQEAFDGMGNAAKDPAVHEDVKEMGRLMKDALLTTFAAVSSEVSERASAAQADSTGEEE